MVAHGAKRKAFLAYVYWSKVLVHTLCPVRNTPKPKASRLHRNLGLLYDKTFKPVKAEESLIKATEINLQDAVSRKILGDLYIKKNELEKASHLYLEVLSLTTRFSEKANFAAL